MGSPKKLSKNNPDKREQPKGKMVISSDCEQCKQCERGLRYLEIFNLKKQGNGVICYK